MYPDKPQMSTAENLDLMKHRRDELFRANNSLVQGVKKTKGFAKKEKFAEFQDKLAENVREVGTANTITMGTPVAALERAYKKGQETEISGDAVARARKGQTPKLHRD